MKLDLSAGVDVEIKSLTPGVPRHGNVRRLQHEAREGRLDRPRGRSVRRRGQGAPLLRGREGAARVAAPGHARRARTARRSAAAPRSSTSRRAPAARVTARSARPIYVGGGQAHPPRPRDWRYRPPRQVRARRAHERALASSARKAASLVVDRFELAEIKTKAPRSRRSARSRPTGEDARRRLRRATRSSSSRSATARTTSSCRPRASTSTTSSATTPSSSPRTRPRRSSALPEAARRPQRARRRGGAQ